MENSEHLATVEAMHTDARDRGLFFQQCEDAELCGRTVTVRGRPLLSFGSCSYLGLERHPALIGGAHEALDRWGTQFSSSRGYLSAPPYAELEALLSRLFGGHALVTSTTTLGHLSALPVLATEKDAIVMDHQAHHSLQMAATLARAGGARVELVRHGELDAAEALVARLARTCRTVWFCCDGVYSMYGDLAPMGLLRRLVGAAPNVRLYVDDAHGMSWAGENGRGSFLSRLPLCERLVLATSLSKGFGAGGGCVVFADERERERVRMCGGPMLFSGPLQPPVLGAALASARVHLSDEITPLQRTLRARVDLCNALLREAGLALLTEGESPIRFVELGLPRLAFEVARRLMEDGVYVTVSAYPTVPMKRAGIRLSLTAAHTPEEVRRVVEALGRHVPAVLSEEGLSVADVEAMFASALPLESRRRAHTSAAAHVAALLPLAPARPSSARGPVASGAPSAGALTLESFRTIHEVDRALWDRSLGESAACSWEAMALQERVFTGKRRPEHAWEFLYLVVRDGARPVAATFLTTALNKDDMLMRPEVSLAVEERRRGDPYFLTSRVTMMGSLLSEGGHLWLDREGPWRAALGRVLEAAEAEHERTGSAVLLLRDFPADDPDMDGLLLDRGLVKVPMLPSHHLALDWDTEDEYLARLGRSGRKSLRALAATEHRYALRVHHTSPGSLSEEELAWLHGLYRNVASKQLRLNVFQLPDDLLPAILASPSWELGVLTLDPAGGGPADGRPVAFWAAHRHGGAYAPFLCGLDYRYVQKHGAYRQMLRHVVRRARELGMRELHLGMSADVEKSRLGSRAVDTCVYVQVRDHFHGALLREIAAEVGVGDLARAVA